MAIFDHAMWIKNEHLDLGKLVPSSQCGTDSHQCLMIKQFVRQQWRVYLDASSCLAGHF